MATRKFMGRGQLLPRLAAQVGSERLAKELLIKRGHMTPEGTLTKAGQQRDNMTARERALDRAAKESGGRTPADFTYDPRTNTTRRKK